MLGANRLNVGASCSEITAGRGINGTGDVSLQYDLIAFQGRIRNRHRRHEGFSVRVLWLTEKFLRLSCFNNFTQVHHRDTIGDMFDDAQVMGNKKVGKTKFYLKIFQQVNDLGLNGNVQSGHGLVTNDHFGVEAQSPGNADALPLTAAELMGIAAYVPGRQADCLQKLGDPILISQWDLFFLTPAVVQYELVYLHKFLFR